MDKANIMVKQAEERRKIELAEEQERQKIDEVEKRVQVGYPFIAYAPFATHIHRRTYICRGM